MARLTAPLLSLGASGSIAKALVFSTWKGIPYARVHVIPANPKSVAQQEVRGVFSTLNEMWKRMPAVARLPWDYAVRGLPLTARNRFIQANVAPLIDETTLEELILSVASGQAIAPDTPWGHDEADGTFTAMVNAPTPAVGYTLENITYYAVLTGDPSPVLIRTMQVETKTEAPWHRIFDVPVNGVYDWAGVAFYTRDSDDVPFASAQCRTRTTCTGN